jgi:hypothetical protein
MPLTPNSAQAPSFLDGALYKEFSFENAIRLPDGTYGRTFDIERALHALATVRAERDAVRALVQQAYEEGYMDRAHIEHGDVLHRRCNWADSLARRALEALCP